MRSLIIILFSITGAYAYAGASIKLNSTVGNIELIVNGITYSIDSNFTSIKTNYPLFDTIILEHSEDENILINFKPNSFYSVIGACCMSLDIVPSRELENDSLALWDSETDLGKIQSVLMDEPIISIRTNRMPNDSIFVWHADAACFTQQNFITTNPWKLGVPPKCYFWNNITTLLFFVQEKGYHNPENEHLEEFLGRSNIRVLTSISFRLFDDVPFLVTYNIEENRVLIEYE